MACSRLSLTSVQLLMQVLLYVIVQVVVYLPAPAAGSGFSFFWCPRYSTDKCLVEGSACVQQLLSGPLTMNVVMEDGGRRDAKETCMKLTLNLSAKEFSYTTSDVTTAVTGKAELFMPASQSAYIKLTDGDLTDNLLGATTRQKEAKLYILYIDESEMVLAACHNYLFYHFDFMYVLSRNIKAEELDDTCAIDTIKGKSYQSGRGVKLETCSPSALQADRLMHAGFMEKLH